MNKTLASVLFTLTALTAAGCGAAIDSGDPSQPDDGTIVVAGSLPDYAGSGSDVQPRECDPDTLVCNADGELQGCDHEGNISSIETCARSCINPGGAHCQHIVPRYVPNACDETRLDDLEIAADLDTDDPATCTGGLLDQAGPGLCVIHAHTIHIPAGAVVHVTGSNALALVADNDLVVDGTLDLGAHGTLAGPGGGLTANGGPAANGIGAGGAGFGTRGGAGGSFTQTGGAFNGGDIVNALGFVALSGGMRAAGAGGGGGGGAATLVSCAFSVHVTGTGIVSAGGGGGEPTGGGGAGGYLVLQGLEVHVNGFMVVNGGGGGAGVTTSGADARLTDTPAAGGNSKSGAGAGGAGATNLVAAAAGKISVSPAQPGAGGGGLGALQAYVPDGGVVEVPVERFQATQTVELE